MPTRIYSNELKIEHYLGRWFAIAYFPTWFQKGCKHVTATYTMKEGYIQVENSCTNGNKRQKIVGKAFFTDIPNLLDVQFFWPFKADYLIEYVSYAEEGEHKRYEYAIVGNQNKTYLWILARHKLVPKPVLKQLLDFAKFKGYDVKRLVIEE